MTHASGNQLISDNGRVIADFPTHWAACAAMIQISDPAFRSLGKPTPFELGWVAGLTGEDPRLCPFEKMTAEWREWQSFHGKAVEYVRGVALSRPKEPDTTTATASQQEKSL
jgi:hypothetical protein